MESDHKTKASAAFGTLLSKEQVLPYLTTRQRFLCKSLALLERGHGSGTFLEWGLSSLKDVSGRVTKARSEAREG